MRKKSFAVIGAGVAGLSCARALSTSGHRVVVFEKSRGPGGRISSKRTENGSFDLGCQFLQAKTALFETQLKDWAKQGVLVPWQGRLGTLDSGVFRPVERCSSAPMEKERWVASERSSQLARFLARALEVQSRTRVVEVRQSPNGFLLGTETRGDFGPFDHVVLATPTPQAIPLASLSSKLLHALSQVDFSPVWAVAMELAKETDYGFDAAWISGSPLRWASRRSAQHGRPSGAGWVLHASREWSKEHLDEDSEWVAKALTSSFSDAVSHDLTVTRTQAHRWRFGLVSKAAKRPYLSDLSTQIHYCGDGCLGSSVENAWRSGSLLADAIT